MSPRTKVIFYSFSWKLIFVDILGRIKQWSGIVQNKLEGCKNEIDNLRKELLARACEMDVKMREIEDLKAQITDYQNASLLDGELKKNHKAVKPDHKEEIGYKKDDSIAENRKEIYKAKDQIKEGDDEENAKEARINDQRIEGDAKILDKIKDTVRFVDQINDKGEKVNEKKRELMERIIDEEGEEFARKRGIKDNDQKESTYVTMAPLTVQEKTKRESELESEVSQLRKEYNRVIKERAEYENAIQRALLRGVSSLNVEALRVLRCPPIPCCTPCAPCPATAGIIPPEPVVPCSVKNVRRRPESAAATMSNAKARERNGDQADCTTKRPCASPCCIAGRNRKSVDSSMIFLLRQGNTGNLHDEEAATPVCGSTIVRKIELPSLRRFET
ncbi:uncharacterized protein LOC114939227 [Nylanderia fulva]|uniref:uncharacterized protein LOC114939227 n=1 Tax=Nylanderia fulva TaxID=613905 RepID=UPI0010FB2F3C|nr:uncharacterized protein LOC114939227 [Nylanderia fulva]